MDLQLEAQNMEKFQLKFQSNPQIHFSTPVYPFVTKSVIVESFEVCNIKSHSLVFMPCMLLGHVM